MFNNNNNSNSNPLTLNLSNHKVKGATPLAIATTLIVIAWMRITTTTASNKHHSHNNIHNSSNNHHNNSHIITIMLDHLRQLLILALLLLRCKMEFSRRISKLHHYSLYLRLLLHFLPGQSVEPSKLNLNMEANHTTIIIVLIAILLNSDCLHRTINNSNSLQVILSKEDNLRTQQECSKDTNSKVFPVMELIITTKMGKSNNSNGISRCNRSNSSSSSRSNSHSHSNKETRILDSFIQVIDEKMKYK